MFGCTCTSQANGLELSRTCNYCMLMHFLCIMYEMKCYIWVHLARVVPYFGDPMLGMRV